MVKISLLPKAPPPPPKPSLTFWQRLTETEAPVHPLRLNPFGEWPRVRRFTSSFLTSALIQAALVFFLLTFPFALLMAWLFGIPPERPVRHVELKVIKLDNEVNIADFLPEMKPPGAAKAPGRGAKHAAHPNPGAVHFDPRVTIVSNPPKPDNSQLTLKNDTVKPSPKPPEQLQVPDVVAGGPKPKLEVPKDLTPVVPKVEPPKQTVKPPDAPDLKAEMTKPPVSQPLTPLPPKPLKNPALEAPVTPQVNVSSELPPAPVQLAAKLPDLPTPHLEVAMPPAPAKPAPPPAAAPAQVVEGSGAAAKPSVGSPPPSEATGPPSLGGGPAITAISVNPIPLNDLSTIPGGHHNGQFSISPDGRLGTPGGVAAGKPGAGETHEGPGGDESSAAGKGKGKPGGGGEENPSAANSSLSISGPGGKSGNSVGTMPPLKPADLVYPVKPDTPKAKAPTMVVSGGSFGGGGLRVFGVLHGGKIYTVYFPMPGQSWILQYCAEETPLQRTADTRTVAIQMAPPLTPPAVIDQFDFHRPPQAPGAASAMIILHGTITADGAVKDLAVVQSGDPISDEAAALAFARWKFKPSTRLGAPVALDILIGIP